MRILSYLLTLGLGSWTSGMGFIGSANAQDSDVPPPDMPQDMPPPDMPPPDMPQDMPPLEVPQDMPPPEMPQDTPPPDMPPPEPYQPSMSDSPSSSSGVEKSSEPIPDELPVVRKVFSRAEVQRICAKYQGQLVAFYDDVWQVDHCQRRAVLNSKTVYNLQQSGRKIVDVDGDVVAALPEGEPLDQEETVAAVRGCKQLDGQYVTHASVDIYFIQKCKKRLLPDWETYVKHRAKHGDSKGEVLSISWAEFSSLPTGEPIASDIDDMLRKLLTGDAKVDVIPVDEACAGVDGKVVSYYSRLYRIERCRKREIVDTEQYWRKMGGAKLTVKELSSQQWLSLPDGKPADEKSARKGS